jgi:hypothetical protein
MEGYNFDARYMVPDLADSDTQLHRYSGEVKEQEIGLCVADTFKQTGPIRIVLVKKYRAVGEPEDLKRFPPEGFVSYVEQ